MKITLLGDSIRLIGYGKLVPELLGDDFEVYQPEDNCRFAKYTLRLLFDLKDQMKGSRIVHFNNGLWDACGIYDDGPFTDIDEYCNNMVRIAKMLLKEHDKVIFATTTPVRPENPYDDNAVIRSYNDAVVPKLRELGVIINDLNALLSTDVEKYICDDYCHLSEQGIKAAAEQTASIIRKTAKTLI